MAWPDQSRTGCRLGLPFDGAIEPVVVRRRDRRKRTLCAGALLAAAFGFGLSNGTAIAQAPVSTGATRSASAAPLPGLISHPTPTRDGRRWQMLTAGVKPPIGCVAWSPDGRWLAVGTGRYVRIYDATGVPDLKRVLLGHDDFVRAARFSPDGKLMATASQDGTVRLWDEEGRERFAFREHEDGVQDVCWHPDGKRLASASLDGTVRLWDLDGKVIAVLSSHEAPVNAVAWSSDGRRLATGCQNKVIRLWSPDGQPGPILEGHVGEIQSLAWNSDGTRLLSGDRGMEQGDNTREDIAYLKVWDVDGKLVSSTSIAQPVTQVCWHPNGKQALVGGFFTVAIWPVAEGKSIAVRGGGQQFTPVAWRPSGDMFIAGANILGEGGNLISALPQRVPQVNSLDQNPDGSQLAVGSADGILHIFTRDGKRLHRSEPMSAQRPMPLYGMKWSPDGKTIIPGQRFSADLQRFDSEAKKSGDAIKLQVPGVSGIDMTRDGRYVAVGGDSMTVQLIDLETATVTSLGRQLHGITQVRFTRDEQQVCSAGFDASVRFWSRDGKAGKVLEAIQAPVRGLAWSRDGALLATGHEDNLIRLWGSDGTVQTVIGGHGHFVQTLDFHPDDALLASGSWDQSVRLWKRDGSPVSVLRGHEGSVFAVQWARDGRGLYSGATDGILRSWDPATGSVKWQAFLGAGGDFVSVDEHGNVLDGNEQLLESDFVCFVENHAGQLVRTNWLAIRAALPPAASTPAKAP